MRRFILLTCVLLCTMSATFAQLTGTKTIPGDYATVADAVTALNTLGVGTGGVTFNVVAGHTETAPTGGIVLTATGTASDPILFVKSGAGANPLITAPLLAAATAYDGVIKITGGDYITFDAIDIVENAGNTTMYTDWGFALVKASNTAPFNGCQYVTIRNCNISLNKANTTAIGIYSGNHIATSTTSLTITATTDATNNCKFYGNNISNVYGGITIKGYLASSPYTLYDQNNEIGVDGANTITNLGGAASSIYGIYTIYQNGLKVANNVINSSLVGLSGSTGYGIFTSTGTSSNVDIYNNTVTLTYTSGAYTSTINGINNAMGGTAAGNTVNIYNNTVTNCDLSALTTGSFNGIVNSGAAANVNIYNNTVSGTTLGGSGAFLGIYNSASMSTNALNIYGNTVSGNTKSGSGGNMYCIQATTATINLYQNSIHDNTAAGTSTFYGYYNGGSPVSETYRDNSIYNLTHSGTGTLNAFQISTASGVKNVYGNTIYNLSSGGTVNAYSSGYGSPTNIYKNNIYNLTTTGLNTVVAGISYSGTSGNIYNNFISDLKAPADSNINGVIGINLTGGTTQNVYFNTIYLAASTSATSKFGTSGIFASATPTVELRNNIVVNTSTAVGTGLTTAYRRSSASLTTYAATSNNNCFYAGAPSASNVIFYDGTTPYQTMGDFQTLVAPIDGQSFSSVPPFVNIAAAPYDLHLQPTVGTMCESGGSSVTGITDDVDGHVRFGETGYTGTGSAPDVGADEFEGMPSFTCVAPTPGNTLASSNPLCNGETVILGLQNTPSGTGISYQWQYSADGGTFSNISGATNSTLVLTPDTSAYYQCEVTCQNGPSIATSAPLHLTFNSMISSVTPASRCGLGTVNLAATGTAANIVWYDVPTGGTPLYTGPTFTTPILNDTTTYYVATEVPAVGAMLGAGASSGSGTQSPFYHVYGGMKSQWLILASELTAAGLTAGNITTFGINVVSPGIAYNDFVLSMGTTTATAMTSTFESGLTPVFASSPAVLTSGINTIPIAPFAWNGTSNIIIQTCWSNNNGGGTSASVRYDATPFVAQAYFRADNLTAAKVCDTLLAYATASYRPQMFLNYIPLCSSPREPVTATVRPAPAVTASATQAAVCDGSSTQISATSPNDPNYTYNWMPNAQTGATHTITPSATTTYVVTANDASGGANDGCVNTASVTVTVNALPTALTIMPTADTLCPDAIQLLSATGGISGGAGVIGTGTSSSTSSTPFRGYYGGQKLQMLFLASELSALGMTSSLPISKISFDFATFTGPYTFNGFNVGMKNTTSSTTSTTLETGLTEVIPASSFVLSGTAPFTQTLTLATPFQWDGTSNLLIETCFNNNDGGGASGNTAAAYYTTTGTYLTAYFSGDNSATVCSAPGSATRSYSRPNVGFDFTSNIITWSPTTGLYTDAAATVPYTGTATTQVYAKPAANSIYTATATNPANCTTTATSTLTIDDLAVSNVTATNITCNGLTNGSITVTSTGGYAGFAYSVDGGTTWQKSNSFTSLAAGSYTVMVKDTLNCPASYASNPVVITEPTAINITSAVPTIVSSCQLADGTITVTATGGTGTLQYSADGTNWFTSNVLNNLAAGNYNVQVKDDNNCIVSYAGNPVSIGTPPAVIIDNVATTNSSCFGSDNGTITITASAGTLPYTYSIDGGTTYLDNSGAFTGLADGSYNVYVKDANTCITIYASNPVVITEPDALALTLNQSGTSCNGGSDGSAWVSVTGGTAPYSYLWNPTSSMNDTIFNVAAGTYHVGIMDLNGCTAIDSIIVTQPAAISITNLIASNTLCDNSTDGAITIVATGGTGTLQYSIDNGTTWQPGNAFYALPAASYNVMVKDANDCSLVYASNPVIISNPTPVVVNSVVSTDVNCYGINDGTITITASGGTGTLMFSINGGGTWQADGDYTGLFAASRSIMVKDANGCVAAWANNPVVITMPTQISVSATVTNVLCLGGSDGTIDVSATGGTPGYEYSIDNGTNYQASANFAGLAAGSYTIKVIDDNGCVKAYASNPVVITEPASAVSISSAVGSNLLCNNGADGSILVTATGGTGAYEYSADNGVTWVTTANITGLSAGNHIIRVRDENGCSASFAGNPIILTEPDPIFITGLTPTNVLCNGGADGSIEVYSVGGTGTLQYSVNGGTTWQSSYSFTGLTADSYIVQVRDANGCIMPYASNPVVITEPAAINLASVAVVENLCYGDNNASITITANGGFGTLEYTINNGISWTSGNAFTGLIAGSYNVKVRDENGCVVNYTGNPIVMNDPAEIVIVSVDATPLSTYGGNDGTIQVVAYGGTGALQYSNDNGTTWQYSNFFIDLVPGGYYMLVKDANGCIITYGSNPVIVSDFDGIAENGNNSNMAVYPNPTENEITIEGSFSDQILSIEIISVEGKIIDILSPKDFVANNMKTSYVFAAEVNGVYFVRVITDQHVYLRKVTVN